VLVLQGCYDAGVVYLKENAAGLIVLALIMAVILVCIVISLHHYGSISLVFDWPFIRMCLHSKFSITSHLINSSTDVS